MLIYFIRHAQSENNAITANTGLSIERVADPGLTDIGRRQAASLADHMHQCIIGMDGSDSGGCGENQHKKGVFLYTSFMIRAVETAMSISQAIDVPARGRMEIHECGGVYRENTFTGELEGLPGATTSNFREDYPNLIIENPVNYYYGWWNRPFEKIEERLPRAKRFIKSLFSRHGWLEDDTVILISHMGFYNVFLLSLLGHDDYQQFWFSLNNAAISKIHVTKKGICLDSLNHYSFLPVDLITS